MSVEVKLKKEINTYLGMRYLAEQLFENLPTTSQKIKMNFKDIRFMSRSFAQEYVYQKEHLENIEIMEENMDENIQKMFEVVYNSQK